MSENNLFGGPRTLITVALVVLIVAILAVIATFVVRGIMGPPEGTPPAAAALTSIVVQLQSV